MTLGREAEDPSGEEAAFEEEGRHEQEARKRRAARALDVTRNLDDQRVAQLDEDGKVRTEDEQKSQGVNSAQIGGESAEAGGQGGEAIRDEEVGGRSDPVADRQEVSRDEVEGRRKLLRRDFADGEAEEVPGLAGEGPQEVGREVRFQDEA